MALTPQEKELIDAAEHLLKVVWPWRIHTNAAVLQACHRLRTLFDMYRAGSTPAEGGEPADRATTTAPPSAGLKKR